jgi:hypothetical protein
MIAVWAFPGALFHNSISKAATRMAIAAIIFVVEAQVNDADLCRSGVPPRRGRPVTAWRPAMRAPEG